MSTITRKLLSLVVTLLATIGTVTAARAVTAELAYPHRPGQTSSGLIEVGHEVLEASYQVVDGMAVFDGDVLLGTAQDVALRDAELRRDGPAPESGALRRFDWAGNVIPYEIASSFSATQRADILGAIAHWNERTLIRLQPRSGESDYVRFVTGDGCSSYIGRIGGAQPITLAPNCSKGNAIHEIGHAAGLFHEQSRTDRDQFVRVQWQNIIPGYEHNFDTYDTSYARNVGPYDFDSVMHYPSWGFSVNGQPTLTALDGRPLTVQRNGLSDGDIAGVTALVVGAPTPYAVESERNGRCLEVRGASFARGALVQATPCAAGPKQEWRVLYDPNTDASVLVNLNSFQCAGMPPTASGRPVVRQSPCNANANQRLEVYDLAQIIWFEHASSGECVVASNGKRVKHRPCIFPLLGDDAQTWSLRRR